MIDPKLMGVGKAISAGIHAVIKEFNLPHVEAERAFANAFRDVMVEYGGEGPTFDEWREEQEEKKSGLNFKISKKE